MLGDKLRLGSISGVWNSSILGGVQMGRKMMDHLTRTLSRRSRLSEKADCGYRGVLLRCREVYDRDLEY